jgi:predicted CoA-binding protein
MIKKAWHPNHFSLLARKRPARIAPNDGLINSELVKTVAIIGASSNPNKFGNKAVRAFQRHGYTVYPVNPNELEVEGLATFKSINEVPVRPHKVSVYVPPPVLLKLLPDIAAKGCDELWLNPGTESDAVLAESERLGLNTIQACSIVAIGG